MDVFKSIVKFTLIGIFFLGILVIVGVVMAKAFNIYILSAGILMIVVPLTIYKVSETLENRKSIPVKHLKELKETEHGIAVDLSKCKIVSNSWTSENPNAKVDRITFANEFRASVSPEYINSSLSRVVYTTTIKGKRRVFRSPSIAKDEQTLRMLFEIQKETRIYIDSKEPQYYYFDLEFVGTEG